MATSSTLHIFAYPFKHLHVDGIGDRIDYAEFLHDGSEIHFSVDEQNTARLELPVGTATGGGAGGQAVFEASLSRSREFMRIQ